VELFDLERRTVNRDDRDHGRFKGGIDGQN